MQTLAYLEEVRARISFFIAVTNICQVLRDVEERGRDIEGCIKQWFAYVKPNFETYVEPQRKVAGGYSSEHQIYTLNLDRHYCTQRRGKQSCNW